MSIPSHLFLRALGDKSAPTIVFLHAIATSGWMWTDIAKHLTDFHCLIIDLPGHGQSAGQRWESLAETARQVDDLINRYATHPERHIVGLSFGAYVGLQYLSLFPRAARSAVLSGLNVKPLPNKWLMTAMGALMYPFLKTDLFIGFNARTLKIPARQMADYRQSVRQLSKPAFWQASKELASFQSPDNLAAVQTRTLFLAGSEEHALILGSLDELKQRMPEASTCVVPNVGHGWSGESKLFANVIRSWVSTQRLPAELPCTS